MTNPARDGIDRYLDAIHTLLRETAASDVVDDDSRKAMVAAVVATVGAKPDSELDVIPGGVAARLQMSQEKMPPMPSGLEESDVIGLAVQSATGAQDRHAEGMFFTPRPVADRIAAIALETFRLTAGDLPQRVLDPTCGGGAFLLAAARWFESNGLSRSEAVSRLFGADLDPLAAAATRTALGHWGGVDPQTVHVACGDGFFAQEVLPDIAEAEVIIGNPPFQNQLGESTARTKSQTKALRQRFEAIGAPEHSGSDIVRPYVDTAALFLLDALDRLTVGGIAMMILPQSILATKDTALIREIVSASAALDGLWIADDAGFDASVRVCAPLIRRGAQEQGVSQQGVSQQGVSQQGVRCFREAVPVLESVVDPPVPPSRWSEYAADRLGVPRIGIIGTATVRDVATATAGFRDEYYGLADAAQEAETSGAVQLITSGLIEPLDCRWGVDQCRFAKQRWDRLSVDLGVLSENERIARWATARRVPKLLVATQTKVVEVVADPTGIMVPVTPVISVEPDTADSLWHLAAVLTNPVTSAVALRRTAGAALASGAIKMSAKQVLELPLPVANDAWEQGAQLAKELASQPSLAARSEREDQLVELGVVMCEAYAVAPDPLVYWWAERLGIPSPVVTSTVSRAKMDANG